MSAIRCIGICTGGGDAPGLNAVIRAVVKCAFLKYKWKVIGIPDGFDGLIWPEKSYELKLKDVSGILPRGGTILGTTNRGNPFRYCTIEDGKEVTRDISDEVIANSRKLGIDAVISIGGEGSQTIALELFRKGMQIVGVPKTIDNDLSATEVTFGFDTAVTTATDAVDKIHTTAESHHRIMVVEVMGRYAGWIALYTGVAGGADAILIPEIPFDLHVVANRLRARDALGAKFSIVVIAEGAFAKGGEVSLREMATGAHVERLGGVSARVSEALGVLTGKETRWVVLGHLQRGGAPTSFDRLLATRFGAKAVELAKQGQFDTMVASEPPHIVARRLADVVGKTKTVPLDFDLVLTAKSLGVTFGD